jgi:prepilin-type processing-associated H-X9-DG protein
MFKSLPRRAVLGAALLAVLLAPNAVAAGADHREQIQIESWSLEPARSGSGLSAGKVSYSDLSVMISLEKAAPLANLASGQHYDRVELRSGDDKRLDYMTVTLEEVMVSSYAPAGNGLVKLTLRAPGTGKTMAAVVLASSHSGGVNMLLLDGSVR